MPKEASTQRCTNGMGCNPTLKVQLNLMDHSDYSIAPRTSSSGTVAKVVAESDIAYGMMICRL